VTIVMQEMLRCLDTCVDTDQPEEVAQIAAAHARLRDLQATYPASWRVLRRRLEQL
jgi:hypothetical protein